jgi:hypothetical protein
MLDPEQAVEYLQRLGVRFVVVEAFRRARPEQLGLTSVYEGRGIAVFEVGGSTSH